MKIVFEGLWTFLRQAAVRRFGRLPFRCNVCGSYCFAKLETLGREQSSCRKCRSTLRWRSIVQALSVALFGRSLTLPNFPKRPDIIGLGMSDWEGYADPLARKLSYTNTYYHKEPYFDITAIDPADECKYDFIITSDVFEHVPPPVSAAFANLYRLLKPGGVVVFTVPYSKSESTVEHFPDLYDFEVTEQDGRYILTNTTKSGELQTFDQLIFHGGPGSTLEMRLFSESDLLMEFRRAGFDDVSIWNNSDFAHGIYWSVAWSLPIVARKPLN